MRTRSMIVMFFCVLGLFVQLAHSATFTTRQWDTMVACNQPCGLRGDTTWYRIRLINAAGLPVAGRTIYFSAEGDNNMFAHLATVRTDANGYASVQYVIPTDVRWRNVYLEALFDGDASYMGTFYDVRVQIGTRTPQ
jgi:hypothetical protein